MSRIESFKEWLAASAPTSLQKASVVLCLAVAVATPALTPDHPGNGDVTAAIQVPQQQAAAGADLTIKTMEIEVAGMATKEKLVLQEIASNPAYLDVLADNSMSPMKKSQKISAQLDADHRKMVAPVVDRPMAIDFLMDDKAMAFLESQGPFADRLESVQRSIDILDDAMQTLRLEFSDLSRPVANADQLHAALDRANLLIDEKLPGLAGQLLNTSPELTVGQPI